MKKFILFFIFISLISCSSDDDTSNNNPPVVASKTTHLRNGQLIDTLKFHYNGVVKSMTHKILPNSTSYFFSYQTQSKLSKIQLDDIAGGFVIIKTITYNNEVNAKITSITTDTKNIVGSQLVLASRSTELFTHLPNNKITITKQQLNIVDNSVLSQEIFTVDYYFSTTDGKLLVNSITNNASMEKTTFVYDNKYNVYKGLLSLNELALVHWQDQKITNHNIVQSFKTNSSNVTFDNKNYTMTYNGDFCTERKDGAISIDKYTYE